MNCKLCNQNKKLVKAHIIPERFFKSIKISEKPLQIYAAKAGTYPKRSHIGLYDPHILCYECEKNSINTMIMESEYYLSQFYLVN